MKVTEEIVAQTVSQVLEEAHLLKGKVPQGQDWLDGWDETTEQVAFHKQARLKDKKANHKLNNLRRVRRKQVRVMAQTRREDVRKWLGQAQFISLSMDDRQYQKIIRFRCDAPTKPFVHRGILGVLSLEESAVGDFEEDHALRGVRNMDILEQVLHAVEPTGSAVGDEFEIEGPHTESHTSVCRGRSKQRTASSAPCRANAVPKRCALVARRGACSQDCGQGPIA